MNEQLARLRADRETTLRAQAIEAWAANAAAREAREAGYRMAVQHLSWAQCTDLRRSLVSVQAIGDRLFSVYGGRVAAQMLADALPEPPGIETYAEWVAFLEGIDAAAREVEALG